MTVPYLPSLDSESTSATVLWLVYREGSSRVHHTSTRESQSLTRMLVRTWWGWALGLCGMSVPRIKMKTNGTAWKDSGWQILVALLFMMAFSTIKLQSHKSDFGPVWRKMVFFPCEVVVLCMRFEAKASCLALLTRVSQCGSGWAGCSSPLSV